MKLNIISAGAGSGKTYTLTKRMAEMLAGKNGEAPLRASGILATTFTRDSAAELKERVRLRLLEEGLSAQADELEGALIGTVHSVGQQLLKRFAFEAGLSPNVDMLPEEDTQIIFNQSMATILDAQTHAYMHELSDRLGLPTEQGDKKHWQSTLRSLTDLARSNNMDAAALQESLKHSLQSFFAMLPSVGGASAEWYDQELQKMLQSTIVALETNGDTAKTKQDFLTAARQFQYTLQKRKNIVPWHEWVRLSKEAITKKSQDDVADFRQFLQRHVEHPRFHADVTNFITALFDLAQKALAQYAKYKQERGLIDYADMEALLLKLLDNEAVCDVLRSELDLLLVDEFQDTSPIQLAIFVRLAGLVKQAIWVGDPKQSIYGFRGAEPALMQAIIEKANATFSVLNQSWRSREDLVNAVNGLFVPYFNGQLPEERVALEVPPQFAKSLEPEALGVAVQHHNILPEYENDKVSGSWAMQAVARAVVEFWNEAPMVRQKGSAQARPARLGDIAVLCRTNSNCQEIAEALNKAGLPASIAQGGLLKTREVLMVLACLKFIFNEYDTLATAEILRFVSNASLEEIIEGRFEYLQLLAEQQNSVDEDATERKSLPRWGSDNPYIRLLNDIRYQSREFSPSEILQILFEKLEIRRMLAAWPNPSQCVANVDILLHYAQRYEESCTRLHTASTLGGFILWLERLQRDEKDEQAKDQDSEAVKIMTYHKSKGLEWPIVFIADLDNGLRDDIDGLRLISTQSEIDLAKPLAGRLICYWPNPYGRQDGATLLAQAMQDHPDRAAVRMRALDEEARLLYVGLTRACDYLIFTTPYKKSTGWLNRVLYKGEDSKSSISLPPDVPSLIWPWKGNYIPVRYKTLACAAQQPNVRLQIEPMRYLSGYQGEREYASAQAANPADILPLLNVQFGGQLYFARPYELPTADDFDLDYAQVAQIFGKFICADRLGLDKQLRINAAASVLEQYEAPPAYLSAELLMQYSEAFHRQIDLQAIQYKQHRKSFRLMGELQYYLDTLDLHLITAGGEHYFFICPEGQQPQQSRNIAPDQAYRLFAAQQALAPEAGMSSKFFVLFPLEGYALELLIQPQNQQVVNLTLF